LLRSSWDETPMIDWSSTRAAMTADRTRHRAMLRDEAGGHVPLLPLGVLASALHRVAHWLHGTGWRLTARLVWLGNIALTGAEIDVAARIGPGLVLRHPRACALYGRIGADCTVFGQAGIGGYYHGRNDDIGGGRGLPVLEDGVELGPGALVLGPVRIGARSRIGPRCLVTRDLPPDTSVTAKSWPLSAVAA